MLHRWTEEKIEKVDSSIAKFVAFFHQIACLNQVAKCLIESVSNRNLIWPTTGLPCVRCCAVGGHATLPVDTARIEMHEASRNVRQYTGIPRYFVALSISFSKIAEVICGLVSAIQQSVLKRTNTQCRLDP